MEDANFLFSDYSDVTSEIVFEDLEKLIQNFDSNKQINSDTKKIILNLNSKIILEAQDIQNLKN